MTYKCYIGSDTITDQEWSDFIITNENGNIFQTKEMFDLYSTHRNYEPFLISIRDENKNISGILSGNIQYHIPGIKKFSSRAVISGGPLINGQSQEVFSNLFSVFNEYLSGKAVYTEFRNIFNLDEYTMLFEENGFSFNDHLNYIIDLELSEDELWKNLHSKRRNEIRRAVKENITVKEIDYNNELIYCYHIIFNLYRTVKLPLPDLKFFSNAVDILFHKGMLRIFAAYYMSKIVAVMMVLCYKNVVYNWYAAGDPNYYNKYPNDLLPWEIILWAKKSGYKIFDFGGAGSPNKKYGVRDYKKKFGGIEKNYGRYIRIHKPFIMQISKTGFKLWQLLKMKG